MTANSFWDFSNALYARDTVEQACLTLQNEHGLDVNIVLFCLWYGAHYGSLSPAKMQQLFNFSDTWASRVVRPLRDSRRWMKSQSLFSSVTAEDIEELRTAIKRLELQAEQLQQNEMESLVKEGPAENSKHPPEAMMDNLLAYLKQLALVPKPQLIDCYQVIVNAMD